ncbi:hypothetical protein D3C76_01400 [compost metagenome]
MEKLNYEFFKQNVAEVELKEELNMGPIEDFMDQVNGFFITGLYFNEKDEAIIAKGSIGKLNVQPYNFHYQMTIDGYPFDVTFDTDEDLNDTINLIKVVGPNKHFVK